MVLCRSPRKMRCTYGWYPTLQKGPYKALVDEMVVMQEGGDHSQACGYGAEAIGVTASNVSHQPAGHVNSRRNILCTNAISRASKCSSSGGASMTLMPMSCSVVMQAVNDVGLCRYSPWGNAWCLSNHVARAVLSEQANGSSSAGVDGAAA